MASEYVRQLLAQCGAILEGHFVGTSGGHLSHYVAKDRATCDPNIVSELCRLIAVRFQDQEIDVVVAPAVGGIPLATWTAWHLSSLTDRQVLALYAEHQEEELAKGSTTRASVGQMLEGRELILGSGESLIIKKPGMVLKRGFAGVVKGKRVLAAEDVLTTGGSARRMIDSVMGCGGLVVGAAVLANGNNVTAEAVGVDRLEALVSIERKSYSAAECAEHGLCAEGVPINTDFGHGRAFLEAQRKS